MRTCHHTPTHGSAQSNQCVGAYGEDLVEHALIREGYTILARNWRTPHGELDLVARDATTVVAVEVKTRTGAGFGTPFEAVTPQKVRRLRKLFGLWLNEYPPQCQQIRIDVIAVTLRANEPPRLERLQGIG